MPNLTDDQKAASNDFLDFMTDPNEKFMVIQGSAGTGKSFLVKHLLASYESRYKAHCLLLQQKVVTRTKRITATTNKAAVVLNNFINDQMNHVKYDAVKTIHSFLGLRIVNNRHTGKTYLKETDNSTVHTNTLLVIDEASFIDSELFKFLDSHMDTATSKILLVGDPYQLAPVGQEVSIMNDLQCHRSTLSQVMRNSGNIQNECIKLKNWVATSKSSPICYDGIDVIHADGPEFKRLIEAEYSNITWTPDTSKILAWTNRRVQEYNKFIRGIKNLPENISVNEKVITNNPIITKSIFAPVDSLVTTTKVYADTDESSGIQGQHIHLYEGAASFMPYDFSEQKTYMNKLAQNKNWSAYFHVKENWFDLRSPFASSVHKSQGSTYETVFIDLMDIGANWDQNAIARLLYVAFSRASKRVVCYGLL